jgi:NAD(P)-dependent dehydrogenase (short-subunit alcohol dehydrogenase family)/thioester reductase-like protein
MGDLSEPGLGLADFDQPIDHLFHLAAVYDMEASPESSWSANVGGTQHVIEFARSHEVQTFHHVSSIAVAGRYKGLFREDMFDEGQKLDHPYYHTKWEAERIVREAIPTGLRIYRPAVVVGHSETGQMDKIDGPYYFFKVLQKLRYALPQWFPLVGLEGREANLVPVDFVAKAIDYIAHQPQQHLPGNTFHLVDPSPPSMGVALNEFAKAAHAPRLAMRLDTQLTDLIPKTVRSGIKQLPTVKAIRAELLKDLGIPPQVMDHRGFDASFDARDAQRALEGSGLSVPALSGYATRIWDYWERNLDPELFVEHSLAGAVADKRVVVTGASSGIGRQLAIRLADAGAAVLLVARRREKLDELADEVTVRGGSVHVYPGDLSSPDDVDRIAAEILSDHGGVDILVNNAGRSIRRSVASSYERFHDFERTIRLNYFGALKLILAFLPGMRERHSGQIVNVSSIGVQANTPRFSAYVASKSALDAFARCTAPEVVGDGVDITTVYMPLVRTPMIEPTAIYRAFPTLTPDEAAELLCNAIIDRPKRVGTRLGTFGQVVYALSPKTVDRIMNTAYKLFPESAKPTQAAPEELAEEEEMSTEAVAMAYLMRGVHF